LAPSAAKLIDWLALVMVTFAAALAADGL